LRFRFDAGVAGSALVQMLNKSPTALLAAVVDCRLTSAATRPRALLATEFAPLSHMLMNGFFLSQAFDMEVPLSAVPRRDAVVSKEFW
jgi:hypothetical protein